MPEVVLDEVLLGDVVLGDSASSEALPSAEVPPGELPSPDASAEGESESSPVSVASGAAVLGAAVFGVAASEAAVPDVAVSEAPAPCAAEVAGEASDTPSGTDPESPPQAAANSDTKTRTASQQRILDKNAKTPPRTQPPAEKPDADLRARTCASFSVCISISTILRKGVMGMWQAGETETGGTKEPSMLWRMIVVMQCAKTKRAEAGRMRLADGQPVVFVAQPEFAPERPGFVYARPDDFADTGRTWREELVIYNQQHNPDVADIPLGRHIRGDLVGSQVGNSHRSGRIASQPGNQSVSHSDAPRHSPSTEANPLGLLPAWLLYRNKTYRLLADTFGPRNLYIFSAGWGLVRSDFMIPSYDITLSPNATGPDKYKRRRKDDRYDDFAMLPADPASPVIFLGSKAYVPLFCQLTDGCSAQRIIFHNSKIPPEAPDCEIRKYDIPKKTDWHYDAAKALAHNRISI